MIFTFLALSMQLLPGALPVQYLQPAEKAHWQSLEEAFHCSITQHIDGIGQVSFIAEPGLPTQLVLNVNQVFSALTHAAVTVQAADWQAHSVPVPARLHHANILTQRRASFTVPASQLLQSIQKGYWLDFRLGTADNDIDIRLSSVYGAHAVRSLQQCIGDMAPMSWQQARDQQLQYELGQRTVSGEQLEQLGLLARYIRMDHEVIKVLIDGHTDDVGNPLANRLLSQERAEDVAERLIELGVSSSMLEVRAHGDRFPVVSNDTVHHAKNRRVVIRLIRKSS